MFSQPKSAVHQQAAKLFLQYLRPLKRNYDINSAFENADRLLEQAYRQSVSLYCTTNIIKPNVFTFPGRNTLNSLTNQSSPPKIIKTTRDTYLGFGLIIHANNISIHLVRQSFKCVPSTAQYLKFPFYS